MWEVPSLEKDGEEGEVGVTLMCRGMRKGKKSDLKSRELTHFCFSLMQHKDYGEYKIKFSLFW